MDKKKVVNILEETVDGEVNEVADLETPGRIPDKIYIYEFYEKPSGEIDYERSETKNLNEVPEGENIIVFLTWIDEDREHGEFVSGDKFERRKSSLMED